MDGEDQIYSAEDDLRLNYIWALLHMINATIWLHTSRNPGKHELGKKIVPLG